MKRKRTTKPYHQYFTLAVRKGYWKVFYKHLPGKQVSTGLKADQFLEEDAVAWAFENLYVERPDTSSKSPALKEVTQNFFIVGPDPANPICPYLQWLLNNKKKYEPAFPKAHRGRLVNYIWPRFGKYTLESLTKKEIHTWILGLKKIKNPEEELADDSKNKVFYLFRDILDYIVYENLISVNPLKGLTEIRADSKERLPFAREELDALFPVERERLFYIWGYKKSLNQETDKVLYAKTQMWITYFLTQAVTGFRPGEVAGLHIEDLIIERVMSPSGEVEVKGIVAHHTVDYVTREIKAGLKTRNKGVKVKAAPLTDRLEQEFELLYEQKKLADDKRELWFHVDGRPVIPATANKHFIATLSRAEIKRKGRTQYSLRHSLATDLLTVADQSLVNRLMGHTKYRKEYDHRKGIALLLGYRGDVEKLELIRSFDKTRFGKKAAPVIEETPGGESSDTLKLIKKLDALDEQKKQKLLELLEIL